MPEKSLRFGIRKNGKHSSTWKVWTRLGVGKSDVYLNNRHLGGVLKVSLHQSHEWHIAYCDEFVQKQSHLMENNPKGRFIEKWPRPTELSPGVTLAFRIVTPESAVTSEFEESKFKKIHWIDGAKVDHAIEIDILITNRKGEDGEWPGQRGLGTKLVGSFELEGGETLWIVYWEIPKPNYLPIKGNFKMFSGKKTKDLYNKRLRAMLFSEEPDGSRVIHDCVGSFSESSN